MEMTATSMAHDSADATEGNGVRADARVQTAGPGHISSQSSSAATP
jgi:hypothetical protein